MSVLRFLALILLFTILLGSCGRSDMIRVRLLSPVSEAKKDYSIFTDKTTSSTYKPVVDPTTSGGSLYFLIKSIGLGYSTVTTNIEKETKNSNGTALLLEKTTLMTNFADIAFGIGENYSLMWGAGVLLSGGKLDTSLNYGYSGATDDTLKHKDLSGHSTFLVLGHHGYGFETLLGYRTNSIKAEFEEITSDDIGKTGKDFTYESNIISLKTSQVQLGIGFTF